MDAINDAGEIALGKRIRLFPNPTTDMVTLQVSGLLISETVIAVDDITGRTIQLYPRADLSSGIYQMDFSEQSPGVYLVKILVGETWVAKAAGGERIKVLRLIRYRRQYQGDCLTTAALPQQVDYYHHPACRRSLPVA